MLDLHFTPFPELQTERLLLRRIGREDADDLFILRSDAHVLQYLLKEPATTRKEAEDFIDRINAGIDANEAIMWGMAEKSLPGRLIGTICFWQIKKEHDRAEIGYVLHPEFWRRGLMKEAALKVIGYGFDVMKLHSIEAVIDPGNAASAAILESTGFQREAWFRENVFFKDRYYDTVIYSRLAGH